MWTTDGCFRDHPGCPRRTPQPPTPSLAASSARSGYWVGVMPVRDFTLQRASWKAQLMRRARGHQDHRAGPRARGALLGMLLFRPSPALFCHAPAFCGIAGAPKGSGSPAMQRAAGGQLSGSSGSVTNALRASHSQQRTMSAAQQDGKGVIPGMLGLNAGARGQVGTPRWGAHCGIPLRHTRGLEYSQAC